MQFKKAWFADIYKKLLCIFHATSEVMFFSWSPIKQQKKHFSVKIYVKIRTNVLARNACAYGATRDTEKSQENTPRCTSMYS